MKLNTLLLASAATLVASTAFAADLPSKKAAPAAGSVQICKVGGMTGWTLPGSDTCVSVGGYVRFNAQYDMEEDSDNGNLDWSAWGGNTRWHIDTRSNTEVGVVRGFIQSDDFALRRAYVQFAGITAGRKNSIADVLGTQSDAFAWNDVEEEGIDYQVQVGGLNFGIALEAPNNNGDPLPGPTSADNPDIVAHLSGSVAGGLGFAVAAVSHQAVDDGGNDETNGYAVLGNVNFTMNGLRLGVFGGVAENASAYTGGIYNANQYFAAAPVASVVDYNEGVDTESSLWGVSLTYSADRLTIGAEYAEYNAEGSDPVTASTTVNNRLDTQELAIFAGYRVAKGLSVYTEYHNLTTELDNVDTGEVNTLLFRIQRDF